MCKFPTKNPKLDSRLRLRRFASRLAAGTKVAAPTIWLRKAVGSGAGVFSYTPPQERLLLYEEAKFCLKNERFLEIGSHHGASTIVLAQVLKRFGSTPDRKVYCVDTWMSDAMKEGRNDTRATFLRNTHNWSSFIISVMGDSATVVLPFSGECDVVFIDGDHSYEGARRDADRFAGLVRPGGRLIMHDHDRVPVTRVIGELLAGGEWTIARTMEHIVSLVRVETTKEA